MRKFGCIGSLIFLTMVGLAPARAADRTGVAADAIKIGLFGPITGASSVAAKNVYGAAAIYKYVNDNGGINGRKFELVTEDDGCDPNKGIAAVKKLLYQDRVFLLHGAWCSSVALAIKPEIAKNPTVPYMVLGAVSTAISTPLLPNLFHPVATTQTAGEQMAEFALSKPGARKFAIVAHSDEWGTIYAKAAIDKLKERGITPVIKVALERGATDATSQVLAIKQEAPDVVLAFLYPAELGIYLRTAYKLALKTTVVGSTAASVDDTDKMIGIPAALKDVYMAYPLAGGISSPEMSKFAKIFTKYYPSEALDTMAFYTMGGAMAIVEALKRLGPDVTREGLIAELDKLRDFNTGVQSGPMTFTPEDHRGIKSVKMIGLVKQREVLFDKYPPVVR
jgi:branched-chain amino acid transport system substrate-binding protein